MSELQTQDNRRVVNRFLKEQHLSCGQLDSESLLVDYLAEMEKGLKCPRTSSLKMIPAYVSADRTLRRNQPALVLDAGGTNLRCALITLPDSGETLIEHFSKREMPALRREFSAAEFYAEIVEFIATALESYAQRYRGRGPQCLGFCFSYPTKIVMAENGDLDGKLLQWSKEIKVPELVGQYVGRGLLACLRQRFGILAPEHVYIINDTVATLLAGQSVADDADYSDFIGYILGTGINSCYAEVREQIATLDGRYVDARSIINVESGNYSRFPQSPVDREYDALTQAPGAYLQEKACSGRYWGELVTCALRAAARHGILPEALIHLPLQSSTTMNSFLHHPGKPRARRVTTFSPLEAWLEEHRVDINARERIYFITKSILERSALFTATNMAACILRSGGGLSPLRPICLTVDGSTFYALHHFERQVAYWLDQILSESKHRKRYYRIKRVENAPLLGAAIAALGFTPGFTPGFASDFAPQ